MNLEVLRAVAERAVEERRHQLLEPEGFELLRILGISCPCFEVVSAPDEIGEELLARLPGDKVVLKGIAVELLHKSEVGGVQVVPKNRQQVAAAADAMTRSMSGLDLRGILIQEFVAYEAEPGSEALLSLRWDREFGAVVTFGIGGIHAEKLTAALREEAALAIFAPELRDRAEIAQEISGLLVTELMTRVQRGRPARIAMEHVGEVVSRFAAAAPLLTSGILDEIEINPLVARSGRLVALDVLARLSVDRPQPMPDRPLDKLDRLLRPSSIALIGVGERLNPGRLILGNLLREGFDPENVVVVKPGRESIDGCKCFGDIASLPKSVDVLIVSVGAEQVPAVVQETIEYRKAETLILIPGGLEEKTGSEHISDAIRRSLAVSRVSEWRGPLVNGGNCLGVRSQPGRYDTFFLPDYKLPSLGRDEGNVALLAQSGAFLASKTSKLQQLRVRYAISIGNQIDLTLGDYLSYLLNDDRVDLFGVYVEGFRDLDGRKFLAAARRITGSGRRIVLYRAGRSRSGVAAAASHTAAMAGSYRVTRALARKAGAQVVDTLQDFEDLLLLNSRFEGRSVGARRIGAVSNAGYECVAFWDGLEGLEPARFSPQTCQDMSEVFRMSRIDGVVDVRNPLDLTPIVQDAQFEEAVRLVLRDPGVDVGVVGCVPLTGALNTLPESSDHDENVESQTSIASRLVELWRQTSKPWVAVVDAGPAYDTMERVLSDGGVPVFRTADRAARLLELYCTHSHAAGRR